MNARKLNCTFEEYYKDPCKTPSLSSSIAKILVEESPLHAWTAHPRFGNIRRESTDEQNRGKILHKLLLGKGEKVHVMDVDNFRTKLAQQERDDFEMRGHLVFKREDFDMHAKAAARIKTNLCALGFDLEGESEYAIEWEEERSGKPVLCRAMMDNVFINDGVIFDIKTVERANKKQIDRNFVANGFDIQHEAYTRALSGLSPAKSIHFIFLFCESIAPYAILPVQPSAAMREIGRLRWDQAVTSWASALNTNHWPSYSDGVVEAEPPAYVAAEYLGNWKV